MTDFTYEKPNEKAYFDTLIGYIDHNGDNEILDIIKDSKCSIRESSSYSNVRWNGYDTGVYFYVPIDKLGLAKQDHVAERLKGYCNEVMPAEIGFDVTYVEFSPLIAEKNLKKTLIEDLEENTLTLSKKVMNELLPNDIKIKGSEMAEVYLYLYCVENSLRLFIEKIGIDKFGENYFDHLTINKDIKKNIKGRKEKEIKNRWLGVRGDSDLFYLDFEDLNKIIVNNWDIFKSYFPEQNWITTKIKEMADCRHLVAHNSFIDEHGRDVIKTNYISILKQLNLVLE
ncbi:MAG: hypothetical protein ACPK7O_00390 [Methanobacterium sp.]